MHSEINQMNSYKEKPQSIAGRKSDQACLRPYPLRGRRLERSLCSSGRAIDVIRYCQNHSHNPPLHSPLVSQHVPWFGRIMNRWPTDLKGSKFQD